MPIKVPEYESQVSLPAGASREGSVVLPDMGLGQLGKEIAQSGLVLAQVAAKGMQYEQENQLSRLGVEAHKRLYDKSEEYRELPPQEVLSRLKDDFGSIKQELFADLPDPVRNAFDPRFDQIALIYQKSIAGAAQGKLDRHAMAEDLKNFADKEQAIGENGNFLAKFMLTANLAHDIDVAGSKPYWDPVQLMPYRAKVRQLMRDNQLYADVFSSPDGAEKVKQKLLTDPAAYGIDPQDAQQAIAKVDQLVQQREQYHIEQLYKDHGDGIIPAPKIALLQRDGSIRHSTAVKLNEDSQMKSAIAMIQRDPVAFQRDIVDKNRLGEYITTANPKLVSDIKNYTIREAQDYRHRNTQQLMQYVATDDPRLTGELAKVMRDIDHYDESAVKVAKAYLKHQHDSFPSDPETYKQTMLKLAGGNIGPDGRPIVTPEHLAELYDAKRLNKDDFTKFIGTVLQRAQEIGKPQEQVINETVKGLRRIWSDNGLDIDLESGTPVNSQRPGQSRMFEAYFNHVNQVRTEIQDYLKNKNPAASKDELLQVASKYLQEAPGKARQTLNDWQQARDIQNSTWKWFWASPTQRQKAMQAPDTLKQPVPGRLPRGKYMAPPVPGEKMRPPE